MEQGPRGAVPAGLDADLVPGRALTLRWRPRTRLVRAAVTGALALAFAAGAHYAPVGIDTLLGVMAALLALFGAAEAAHGAVTVADASTIRRSARPFGRTVVIHRGAIAQLSCRAQRGDQTNVSVTVGGGGASDPLGRRVSPPTRERTLVAARYATEHAVRARLKDGTDHLVAGPFEREEHARWVEGELERMLRLRDPSDT